MWLSHLRRHFFLFPPSSSSSAAAANYVLPTSPSTYIGKAQKATFLHAYFSTHQQQQQTHKGNGNVSENENDKGNEEEDVVCMRGGSGGKMALAESLASVLDESPSLDHDNKKSVKPRANRFSLKRVLEMRVKKRVKQQFSDGKFRDLFDKVVADPKTLMDAYDSIRVSANVDVTSRGSVGLSLESLVEELVGGKFNVEANVSALSTRGRGTKEVLVLPNLRLRVVQEAMRMVLEAVFRPHFKKISHGGRSGRGHISAYKYICKEISAPDWWFTVHVSKKPDSLVISKLISTIGERIEDPKMCGMIQSMFDAQVLNLEFGGFAKGHGLPQEGVLSPVLMNIYLDLFDDEFYRISMRYEAFDSHSMLDENQPVSKLRSWFRRQIKDKVENSSNFDDSDLRVYCCRFMDEILFAVAGSKDTAISLKSEVQNYFQDILHLDVVNNTEIIPCSDPRGVRFAGASVVRRMRDSPALRAIHKLKEKVQLFASQKQEFWDAGTVRIGKKWLAHGLRKVKESEIAHLADNNSLLSNVSCYRKPGMETDHWYKHLMKIWMLDVNAKSSSNEDYILSKYVAEPALPPILQESFYDFQKQVEKYISSESESLLSLMPSASVSEQLETITMVVAPLNMIKKRLMRYGLANAEGYGRAVSALILQDGSQIVDWFSGIVLRWLRWYRDCANFDELKLLVSHQVRKSCIRTLALKYRIHEDEIEKQFEAELSRILFTQDMEHEVDNEIADYCVFDNDEAVMHGILYSGLCQLSLARIVSQSRPCNCFVLGCLAPAPCVYTLHVMERQKFPGWNTGFSSCIHPSLNRRRIGLCKQHLEDLYLGETSLQYIDFVSWK